MISMVTLFKSETLHKQSSMQACDMMKFKISFHNLWSELFFCLNYVSGVVENSGQRLQLWRQIVSNGRRYKHLSKKVSHLVQEKDTWASSCMMWVLILLDAQSILEFWASRFICEVQLAAEITPCFVIVQLCYF